MPLRPGARLGVDVGDVRIGVAVSDPAALLATPLETVDATGAPLDRLLALSRKHAVIEVVVGLPLSLSGAEGPAAARVRSFAAELAAAVVPTGVRLVDERLSTVSAERSLRADGRRGARHGARRRRVVDQAAAVVILQTALDTERNQGMAPGELVAATAAGPAPRTNGRPGD